MHIKLVLIVCVIYCFASPLSGQPEISLYQRARAFDINSQTDSAITYYNNAQAVNFSNANIPLIRGMLNLKTGSTDKAISDFNSANKLEEDIANFQLAKCYSMYKDTAKTILYLTKHLKSKYKLQASVIRLEPTFSFLEKTEQWNKLWQNDWYSKNDQQEGEARYLLESENWMGTINYITETAKNGNIRSEMLIMRAEALAQMGNAQMALTDLNIALQNQHRNAEAYIKRGKLLLQLKQPKNAEKDFSYAINIAPDVFDAFYYRAKSRLMQNNSLMALDDAEILTTLFPLNNEYQFIKCQVLYQAERYIHALAIINTILQSNSSNSTYLLFRARTYSKSGMTTNAMTDYNQCLRMDATNINALRERGSLRFDTDDLSGACSDWKKAEKLGDIESGKLVWQNCK